MSECQPFLTKNDREDWSATCHVHHWQTVQPNLNRSEAEYLASIHQWWVVKHGERKP